MSEPNAYAEVWFDLGMSPDLSDAVKVGKPETPQRYEPSRDGARYYNFTPSDLQLSTT